MSDLLGHLENVVGPGGVLTGDDVHSRASGIWRSDGIKASAIVRPRNTEEVSDILRICNEMGQSVVPHGGLTGLVESAITDTEDVALSLERMNQVEEINAVDRTITVESGVVLQTVQEVAENSGLMYPLDIGARGSSTVGGNIATNAGGNRVLRYGMTRDMVLGLEAVLANGTVVSSMNEMIKNNAGYDLKQLFIGTEGSLGVVTRAVLRLREQPRSQETLLVAVDQAHGLDTAQKAVDHRGGANDRAHVVAVDLLGYFAVEAAEKFLELDLGYIGIPGLGLLAVVFVVCFALCDFLANVLHCLLHSYGRYILYSARANSAVTTVVMPPRTLKSPTTVICRGAQAATRSSRILLVTASWKAPSWR